MALMMLCTLFLYTVYTLWKASFAVFLDGRGGVFSIVPLLFWRTTSWSHCFGLLRPFHYFQQSIIVKKAYFFVIAAVISNGSTNHQRGSSYGVYRRSLLCPRNASRQWWQSGFGWEDLDSTMRMVFYPGIIAFTLLGFWLSNIYYRIKQLDDKMKQ